MNKTCFHGEHFGQPFLNHNKMALMKRVDMVGVIPKEVVCQEMRSFSFGLLGKVVKLGCQPCNWTKDEKEG